MKRGERVLRHVYYLDVHYQAEHVFEALLLWSHISYSRACKASEGLKVLRHPVSNSIYRKWPRQGIEDKIQHDSGTEHLETRASWSIHCL